MAQNIVGQVGHVSRKYLGRYEKGRGTPLGAQTALRSARQTLNVDLENSHI